MELGVWPPLRGVNPFFFLFLPRTYESCENAVVPPGLRWFFPLSQRCRAGLSWAAPCGAGFSQSSFPSILVPREFSHRLFGACSFPTFKPRATAWAAFLRRFATVIADCVPLSKSKMGCDTGPPLRGLGWERMSDVWHDTDRYPTKSPTGLLQYFHWRWSSP